MSNKKNIFTLLGATIATSLCCVTPVLAVLAGSSSLASSFSWLSPYHNYLVGFTIIVLIYAWYDKLKTSKAIECDCDDIEFISSKSFLAIVTLFTVIMLTFPQWGSYYFEGAPTAKSCSSGSSDACFTINSEVKKPIQNNTLPVLQYMHDERISPTDCNQKACTGTGRPELDSLLAGARNDVPEMSPAVLKKMLDNSEDVILLDVRGYSKNKKYDIYTDDESYAISRCDLEFKVLNQFPDKDATIVVYSRLGARSLLAAQAMKQLGFISVYNLTAGTIGWARAGYPFSNKEEEKIFKTENEI